jgi:hypothetical protein
MLTKISDETGRVRRRCRVNIATTDERPKEEVVARLSLQDQIPDAERSIAETIHTVQSSAVYAPGKFKARQGMLFDG